MNSQTVGIDPWNDGVQHLVCLKTGCMPPKQPMFRGKLRVNHEKNVTPHAQTINIGIYAENS